MTENFLFEIGCEELPPKALPRLSQALQDMVQAGLDEAGISYHEIKAFAGPRRLAIAISQLASQQADKAVKKQGPFIQAAFDEQGQPTPAGLGFARSCGVDINELMRESTDKGERLFYETIDVGLKTTEIIPAIFSKALKRLPIPKMMRWGASDEAFVRPVHWCVCLFGADVVDATFFGIKTNRLSYGHRFHHPDAINLASADDYEQLLYAAKVVADFDTRKALIIEKIQALVPHKLTLDDDLLNEVTAIVEWPVPLLCEFDEAFLKVPKEALIASLRDHQKCFHVDDANGHLTAQFITVSNIESTQPQQVKAGNQRVVRARLADAAFFFQTDCAHPLADLIPRLAQVTFQKQLGSQADRVARLSALAQSISQACAADEAQAMRAASLSKCDLLTLMVGEFPELQGTMGRYYAHHSGEDDAVAQALEEQYLPRFAKDSLPQSPCGNVLAIAERIDKLVGIFGINQVPSGEKDPFALRRAAVGLIRILIENQLPLNLLELLNASYASYQVPLPNKDVIEQVHQFIIERMKTWYSDQGISPDVFAAVCARENNNLLDMHQRLFAVRNFRQHDSADALAAANKRVSRILLKEGKETFSQPIQQTLLQLAEEKQLAEIISAKQDQLMPLFAAHKYNEALLELADLREPVDRFFDNVMVMVDEKDLRNNRLALLTQLRQLFLEIADISLLQ